MEEEVQKTQQTGEATETTAEKPAEPEKKTGKVTNLIEMIFGFVAMGLTCLLTLALWVTYATPVASTSVFGAVEKIWGSPINVVTFCVDNIKSAIQVFENLSIVSYEYLVFSIFSIFLSIAAVVVAIIALVQMILSIVNVVKKNYGKAQKNLIITMYLAIVAYVTMAWMGLALYDGYDYGMIVYSGYTPGVFVTLSMVFAFTAVLAKIVLNFVFRFKDVAKNFALKDVLILFIRAAVIIVMLIILINTYPSDAIYMFIYFLEAIGFRSRTIVLVVCALLMISLLSAILEKALKIIKHDLDVLMNMGAEGYCNEETAKKKVTVTSTVPVLVVSAIAFVVAIFAKAYLKVPTGWFGQSIALFIFALGMQIALGVLSKVLPGKKLSEKATPATAEQQQ